MTTLTSNTTTADIGEPTGEHLPLPAGVLWHQLFYPPYRFREGKFRQRQYATLRSDTQAGVARLTTEHGETWAFPLTSAGYADASRLVATQRLTAFTTFVEGARRFPYLGSAIADEHSRIYLTEARGPVGVAVRYGRTQGTFISENSWYRDERDVDDATWLRTVRRVMNLVGIGSYDTPAALGTAVLYRMWEREKLPHVMRLPGGMMELLLRYRIGGRVTHENSIGHDYPLVYESDIRSAYPTAVAQGLPWGTPLYEHADPTGLCASTGYVAYGLWRITTHSRVEFSPVPSRDWSHPSSGMSWANDVGVVEYAGWLDEITALRATGHVTAEWLGGWLWAGLSTALAPWVEEMGTYRDMAATTHEPSVERLLKLATNAAIGRWGIDPTRLELVDHEHSQIGDGFVSLPAWAYMDSPTEPPDLFVHRDTANTKATPAHWSSFVRMRVRMELYARSSAGRSLGITIVMENFDALVTTAPLDTRDSPYKWKVYRRFAAHIPYARAIESWIEDGYGGVTYIRILPGVAQRMRPPAPQPQESMAP